MIVAKDVDTIRQNFKQQLTFTEEYRLRNGEVKRVSFAEAALIDVWATTLHKMMPMGGVVDLRDIETVMLNSGNDFSHVMKILRKNKVGKLSLPDRLFLLKRKLNLGARIAHHYNSDGQGDFFWR